MVEDDKKRENDWMVRHIAWFLLAIVAAFASPSTDAISMLLLWLPAGFLFEAGFFAYRRWWRRARQKNG
jgi:Sec-independent protein secretion pathway component TatC